MATLESIQARIAKLQAQAEQIVIKKSSVVLERIRELMDKHGVTVSDIEAHVGNRRGRKAGTKAAAKPAASHAKYREPKTGATWTGHGRAPAWIATAKDRNKFLIDGASPTSAIASGKAGKVGNYVRGPQPPQYRDPKSGATWSGRGRAPAWIANAKDRSRFLIAEAEGASTKATAAASRKAKGAGKVAIKKTTGSKVAARKRAPAAGKSKTAARKTRAKTAATKTAAAANATAEKVASTV
ncbi:MAG TPA: H-NS family nucleoid-associated regulatory protein [Paraburkholderia sp.]|jgi:DNA-binding protein H-NS